jgi:hypothetical protein
MAKEDTETEELRLTDEREPSGSYRPLVLTVVTAEYRLDM